MTILDALRAACDGRRVELAFDGERFAGEHTAYGAAVGVIDIPTPDGRDRMFGGLLVRIAGGTGHWESRAGEEIIFDVSGITNTWDLVQAERSLGGNVSWAPAPRRQ